ncbi:MAG: stage II sporulation protein SpoIID, partial [Chthonomonadales bacterium]
RKKIGMVRSFEIIARDVSGRATRVAINGEEGSLEMRAAEFRALVGYDKLLSTLMKVTSSEETIKIEGRGYGHGHGMCQSGAMGMAAPPYNHKYKEILLHYFPGAEVKELK